jgi:hypothetical protein
MEPFETPATTSTHQLHCDVQMDDLDENQPCTSNSSPAQFNSNHGEELYRTEQIVGDATAQTLLNFMTLGGLFHF